MNVHQCVTIGLIAGLSFGCNPNDAGISRENNRTEARIRLPILEKAISFHGGSLYNNSEISLTISSLSGEFDIVARAEDGLFDYTVISQVGSDLKIQRKVRLTNTTIQRWDDGVEVELDEQTAEQVQTFVNARVFFPLLPYSVGGAGVLTEDLGIERWDNRGLHKIKITFQPNTSNDADDSYMFWFDPETGRMEQFAYDFAGGLRFRKATKFNRVGGILFSDQENYAVDGGRISVDVLTADYVRETMKLLSVVKINNIDVEALSS